MQAAFNAWVEELRADQAQFSSDKVLNLAYNFSLDFEAQSQTPYMLQIVGPHFFFLEDLDTAQGIAWCYTSWGVQGFLCSYPMPSPRVEKEGVRQRAKLVKQLEDKQTLCPKSKFNLQ